MANYRLSPEAKDDLIRIYSYGIFKFGVVQADLHLSELAYSIYFQSWQKQLRLWPLWVDRILAPNYNRIQL